MNEVFLSLYPCHSISITFTDRDGDVRTVKGKIGDSLMEVAKEYDIDLEGTLESIVLKPTVLVLSSLVFLIR